MTNSSLLERAAARIDGLIDRGAHICGAFNPEGETLHCHRCGYPADTHLIRDLRLALETQPACQHGSVCRAHFETLRERCEAAEAALEARTQELEGDGSCSSNPRRSLGLRRCLELQAESIALLQAAKDAAEANLAAEQLGNQTITDELMRQHRVAEAKVQALEAPQACPCLHTVPCQPRCTCVMPLSSSGCRRCCSYGSKEQQRAMAEMWEAKDAAIVRAQTLQRQVNTLTLGDSIALGETLRELASLHAAISSQGLTGQGAIALAQAHRQDSEDVDSYVQKHDELEAALRGLAQQMREEAMANSAFPVPNKIIQKWAEILEALVRPTSRVEKAATYQIHPRDREPVEPTEPQKENNA